MPTQNRENRKPQGAPNTASSEEGRGGGKGLPVPEATELPVQCLHSHLHTNRTLDSLNNVECLAPRGMWGGGWRGSGESCWARPSGGRGGVGRAVGSQKDARKHGISEGLSGLGQAQVVGLHPGMTETACRTQ